ncbi:MAG: hypothetical protein KF819_15335 [Labilithrix sp.]|nr:hypothetical protein [Labilithrix sp.]
MRFSSTVSSVLVLTSLALGGCAADLDPEPGSQEQGVMESAESDRVEHVRMIDKRSTQATTDTDRARQMPTYIEPSGNVHLEATPPSFGQGKSIDDMRVPAPILVGNKAEKFADDARIFADGPAFAQSNTVKTERDARVLADGPSFAGSNDR